MTKRTASKQMYTVRDINTILRVAEGVQEIRRKYPEHSRMAVFTAVDGAFAYTFKVVRRSLLRFIAREHASEDLLKRVATLNETHGDVPKEGTG